MDHGLELFIPILEILEIEVCNIIYKPRDIGNLIFSTSSYPGNIGNLSFSTSSYPGNIGSYDPYSVLSWKYWKLKSSTFSLILEILENWFFYFSHILEILEIFCFYILRFFQKRRAPKFHAEWSGFRGEISHMRPIQARKLKLFQTPISKWRRWRRRRPNNSPIWPEPWTITPRDQISRSGSIPHFDSTCHA